jgi:hypothetical protein
MYYGILFLPESLHWFYLAYFYAVITPTRAFLSGGKTIIFIMYFLYEINMLKLFSAAFYTIQ